MFETLSDPIDVLTAFVEGKVRPLRFRWHGRVIRLRSITGEWTRREGQTVLRHYSVEGPKGESYELSYDPRGARWTLTRAWTAPPS